MSGFLKTLIDNYEEHLERVRNRPFLEATMAACALIAIADGEVTFDERVRVDQILMTLDQLQVFDPHEGIDLFNDYAEAIQDRPREGREKAWQAIGLLDMDDETKALMLRICLAISAAKGEMPMSDQIEIVSLCSRLGIDPSDCGLYIDDPGV